MDLSSVRDAIERYARAVQEADVDKLRSVTFGVLHEQFPLENTELIVAQLAADTCQYGLARASTWLRAAAAATGRPEEHDTGPRHDRGLDPTSACAPMAQRVLGPEARERRPNDSARFAAALNIVDTIAPRLGSSNVVLNAEDTVSWRVQLSAPA